jgi:G3E family GTPase
MSDPIKPRIPVILVTGFLGAGKTTLLLKWLGEAPATGLRMGVVMNEFGQESVDSQLLQRPGLQISQVSGGCLCCAGDDDVARAVVELARSGRVDYIVVETSGLADPDNVVDVLTDPELLPDVFLQRTVAVVDAHWFAQPTEGPAERILARRQVQFAQTVCLSKCELITESERDSVTREISEIHPAAEVIRMPFGLPDVGRLLKQPPAEYQVDLDSMGASQTKALVVDRPPEGPHLHTSYQSVTWKFPIPVDRSRFEEFLSRLNSREVVRAKGFVRFAQQPEKLFLFQSVFGHHVIEEYEATPHPNPVAVLIGPSLNAGQISDRLRSLVFGVGSKKIGLN